MSKEKLIIDFLRDKMPLVKGIYLFGSQADGTANRDSDYDIAYLNEYTVPKDAERDFNLSLELGDFLGATVESTPESHL